MPRWFILTVGSVTLAVWVAAFVATIAVPGYKADPLIGYAAMAVVAACFGSDIARKAIEKAKDLSANGTRKNEQPVNDPSPDNRSNPSGGVGAPP
jgi:hypothetical protein